MATNLLELCERYVNARDTMQETDAAIYAKVGKSAEEVLDGMRRLFAPASPEDFVPDANGRDARFTRTDDGHVDPAGLA